MKNSFVRATALTNVSGRIDYISNPAKQERLMAFCDQMPAGLWKELGKYSRQQAELYHKGQKACEGRELIVMLPNSFARFDPNDLARVIAENFRTTHDVPCAVAIHWNKKQSNYHAHVVFSERELAKVEPARIATRNTYFNAEGKRSTKKECTDDLGALLPGCRFVAKGQNLAENTVFGAKKNFSRHTWLQEEKDRLTQFFNQYDKTETWKVYDRKNDYHLTMMHVGTGESSRLKDWIMRENERTARYNAAVDELIASGSITPGQAMGLKFKVLRERKAMRQEREAERARYIADQQARRAAERDYRRVRSEQGVLALVVELALTLGGVDTRRFSGVSEIRSAQNGGFVKVYRDYETQRMIDDMYITLGQTPPSQRVAKVEINLADGETKVQPKRKLALDDVIASAEKLKQEQARGNVGHVRGGSEQGDR